MIAAAEYIIEQLEWEANHLPEFNDEIVQHLIELGYLSILKANALLPGDVDNASATFMSEATQSGFFDDEIQSPIYLNQTTRLRSMLRIATDTNQGIIFGELPMPGELNIATRIIHYRLELMGLWPLETGRNFSHLTIEKIKLLATYARRSPIDSINLLADIDQFTKQLIKENTPESFVIVFKSPHADNKTKKAIDRRHAFKRQLIEDFGERSDFIKYLAGEILKNNPSKIDYSFLEKAANDPFGQFIMRLVQVHQWEQGFYNGLLDSDIGEVTIRSILDSIEFYNESDNKNIKTHRVITSLHGDFFLFNALFFLRDFMGEEQEVNMTKAQEEITKNLSDQMIKAGDQEIVNFNSNFNLLKSEIFSDKKTQVSERKGLLRRVYYGLKNLVNKAFRFADKMFAWISKKALKMWGFLKNLFRGIFENLQLGIKAFVEGIKFILGNRTFETENNRQAIISRFGIDGDSVSITTDKINEVLKEHLGKTSFGIKSMKFTMAVVEGVLSVIVRAINIITWPLLLLQIARIYSNIILSFKELKLLTTK